MGHLMRSSLSLLPPPCPYDTNIHNPYIHTYFSQLTQIYSVTSYLYSFSLFLASHGLTHDKAFVAVECFSTTQKQKMKHHIGLLSFYLKSGYILSRCYLDR